MLAENQCAREMRQEKQGIRKGGTRLRMKLSLSRSGLEEGVESGTVHRTRRRPGSRVRPSRAVRWRALIRPRPAPPRSWRRACSAIGFLAFGIAHPLEDIRKWDVWKQRVRAPKRWVVIRRVEEGDHQDPCLSFVFIRPLRRAVLRMAPVRLPRRWAWFAMYRRAVTGALFVFAAPGP